MVAPPPLARTALVVNPAPDVYGADLQMLQTVTGLVGSGWRVVVALPGDGELVSRIQAVGAEVVFIRFPVLRKGNAAISALATMLFEAATSLPRSVRLIKHLQTSLLVVNTVTLPWWLLAGRLSGAPTICHLHEAETQARRIVRKTLVAPLWLADVVIVISKAARDSMVEVQPRLEGRAQLIYNGVPQPPTSPADADRKAPIRLAVIGRLSPRKAPDVALEAVAALRRDGYDVQLEVAGSIFEGYEWYEDQLRSRAAQPDLAGSILFSGYRAPIWPVLADADIVVAPSLNEPFGNAVVEAQLSRRPVVAAASQGHLESIDDSRTGLLVPPGDAEAMAAAVKRLIDHPALAARIAMTAEAEAIRRFSVDRYRSEVVALAERVAR